VQNVTEEKKKGEKTQGVVDEQQEEEPGSGGWIPWKRKKRSRAKVHGAEKEWQSSERQSLKAKGRFEKKTPTATEEGGG